MHAFKITQTDRGLKIVVHAQPSEQEDLLGEFENCQQGQCTCPTQEYEKLESMNLEVVEDQINIQLVAKDRMAIDQTEIARCLDHTAQKLNKGKNDPEAP